MKNNQKIIRKCGFIVFLTVLPLLGFGNEPPEQVLLKYLHSFYSNNHKKAYKYISESDKNAISRENFVKQNSIEDPFRREMMKLFYSLIEFEVNEAITDVERAFINISLTAPDMPRVLAEIFGPFYGPKTMKNPQETMRYLLKHYLKKGNVPMTTSREEFTLVNEEGHWKILLNLKNNL